MKVSDLIPVVQKLDRKNYLATSNHLLIELPKTDACQMIYSDDHMQQFIEVHGDLEIEYDERYKTYRVPTFKEGRKEYSDAKQRWCDQYGCD